MFHRNQNAAPTYGIIGLGRFGFALALELALTGADLLVLDADEGARPAGTHAECLCG